MCPENFGGKACIYYIPGKPSGPGSNDVPNIPTKIGKLSKHVKTIYFEGEKINLLKSSLLFFSLSNYILVIPENFSPYLPLARTRGVVCKPYT